MDPVKQSAPAAKPAAKKQNPWLILSIVLAIALIAVIVTNSLPKTGGQTEPEETKTLSASEAADKLLSFINEVYGAQIGPVTLKGVESDSGLYKVSVTITDQGQPVDQIIYVTKDAEIFIPQIIRIAEMKDQLNALREQQLQLQAAPPQEPPAEPAPEVTPTE